MRREFKFAAKWHVGVMAASIVPAIGSSNPVLKGATRLLRVQSDRSALGAPMHLSANEIGRQSRGRTGRASSLAAHVQLGERIACTVKNLSDVGAGIYVQDGPELPGEFDIRIVDEGRSRCCVVVRRGKRSVRVVFV
jgi:hypothetical protein